MAFLAGVLFGLDRESHGRVAGLRTTILVTVATCITMILALLVSHNSGISEANSDYSRYAQGILTGIGFLGAGCIIKQGEMVRGVTTAAMIWYMAIIGMAFGLGLWVLGLLAVAVGLFNLVLLATVENHFKNDWFVRVTLVLDLEGISEEVLCKELIKLGTKVKSVEIDYDRPSHQRIVAFEVRVRNAQLFELSQKVTHHFSQQNGVQRVKWSQSA